MPKYSEGFKEQRAVQMMMAPNAMSVAQVSRDTGVSEQTLYNWRNRFRHEGKAVPADPSNPENWSGENKLAVVIETAALNEEELGGVLPSQRSLRRAGDAAGEKRPLPVLRHSARCRLWSAGNCSRNGRRRAS